MEAEMKIQFTLNELEYSALKTLLGKQSGDTYREYGLTTEQIYAMGELYGLIPYGDDE